MPAYSFRAAGTVAHNSDASALSPGAPAGTAIGDLLMLFTGHYNSNSGAELPTLPEGWVNPPMCKRTTATGLLVFFRVADGSALDTPTIDWTGAVDTFAWIEAYSGDVYQGDLRGIVVALASDTPTTTAPSCAATPVNKDNCLLVCFSAKRKTATSDNATTVTAPASQSLVLRQSLIQSGTALVAATASVQQTTQTDYDGTDFTMNGTAESLGTANLTFFVRTEDGSRQTMFFDFPSDATRTDTSTPQTISRTASPFNRIAGVLAFITHGTSNTDHIGAGPVTYGGVNMTRIQRNTDSTTEPGATEIWFLGAGVPQGTQTLSIPIGTTTDDVHSTVIDIVSDYDLTAIDVDGINDNAANPSVTLQGLGQEIACFGTLYGGGADPASFAENANCERLSSSDLGAFYSVSFRQSVPGVGDFAIGGTAGTDDVGYSACAIAPILPNTLPTIVNVSQAIQRSANF